MLRGPLGDPGLRLRFWDVRTDAWDDVVDPRPGESVTVVDNEGRPAVALIHDAQLEDDPELLRAAGAVAVLAAENAELDALWTDALQDLRRSRARISQAVDDERRRVVRNLHDGVQQRLVAIRMGVALSADHVADENVQGRLRELGDSVESAIGELRQVSHGLYPHLLSEHGLVAALEQAVRPLSVREHGLGRHAPEVESALYYCCLEAIQNATKHSGAPESIAVDLYQDDGELRFEVTDDGVGFDPSAVHGGMGLQNLHDRLGAVDGRLSIHSVPGRGTVVSGRIPLS
jgi:signal transduction histidine kinase